MGNPTNLQEINEDYEHLAGNQQIDSQFIGYTKALGAAGLILLGISLAKGGDTLKVGGTLGAAMAGAGAMENYRSRRNLNNDTKQIVELARQAADISLHNPNARIESWVIRALPEADGDLILRRLQQGTLSAAPESATTKPVDFSKH